VARRAPCRAGEQRIDAALRAEQGQAPAAGRAAGWTAAGTAAGRAAQLKRAQRSRGTRRRPAACYLPIHAMDSSGVWADERMAEARRALFPQTLPWSTRPTRSAFDKICICKRAQTHDIAQSAPSRRVAGWSGAGYVRGGGLPPAAGAGLPDGAPAPAAGLASEGGAFALEGEPREAAFALPLAAGVGVLEGRLDVPAAEPPEGAAAAGGTWPRAPALLRSGSGSGSGCAGREAAAAAAALRAARSCCSCCRAVPLACPPPSSDRRRRAPQLLTSARHPAGAGPQACHRRAG
jgi:hypothetical protein